MQALNQTMVIVRWSRNEMTHQLWPYTPRKRTLGQFDYTHTIGRCIFEPSEASMPVTDVRCVTGSLPSSIKKNKKKKHLIQGLESILTVTVK